MSAETSRMEAFSDGVFGIALTLLILGIKIPQVSGGDLRMQLLRQWPAYLSYAIAFAFIGIMWINHHRLFSHIHRCDNWLLVFNLLLLFGVTTVPFPTAVLATHLGHPGQTTAVILFDGTFVFIAIFFNLLWRHASSAKRQLLSPQVDHAAVKKITAQYAIGPFAYLICLLLAWVSVPASMFLNFALAGFFLTPPTALERRKKRLGQTTTDYRSE
jgi:TMEM175 potassium channel family protein